MSVQLCPECGCAIIGDGYLGYGLYDKTGANYCCEPCANDEGPCTCGCCEAGEV